MAILTYLFSLIASLGIVLWYYIHIPRRLPTNIPSVPIYVSLIALWSDMGQDDIYAKWLKTPLEKHGAVKIWFAGQWSILVTRPAYLTQMFRNENLFAKAGSQVKIPWSVVASLVGDNIINSHGENWHRYTSIMKPGMQKRVWETASLITDSRELAELCLASQRKEPSPDSGVLINALIQRWAIQAMGRNFLQTDLKCLKNPDVRLETLQSTIKRTLFKPLFFNFPHLDKHTWLFRSRTTAYAIMREFGDRLFDLARAVPRPSKDSKSEDLQVVDLLNRALDRGEIDETQFRSNIKITFLTAHENAQQLLNSIFWELGSNIAVQHKLREEVIATGKDDPDPETVNAMPYLTSVIFEMLRLYPPVSQLINRVTLDDAMLGDIAIPKRTWVGWNAYGVHTDPDNWPQPFAFQPERWGTTVEAMQTKFRKENVAGRYIPFNAHQRKCLGQGFALLEMKIVLFELVRRTKWTIDDRYKLKLTSGGILAPLGCRVIFERNSETELEAKKDENVDMEFL